MQHFYSANFRALTMALSSISPLPMKSIDVSRSSSSVSRSLYQLPRYPLRRLQLISRSNLEIRASSNYREGCCSSEESNTWKRILSAALAAAVIVSSSGVPAMAELNKFEADTRGEFGIGSAAQFGSANLSKTVHSNENFRRANFTSADMRESDFSGSTFNGAYLEKAVAYKANFSENPRTSSEGSRTEFFFGSSSKCWRDDDCTVRLLAIAMCSLQHFSSIAISFGTPKYVNTPLIPRVSPIRSRNFSVALRAATTSIEEIPPNVVRRKLDPNWRGGFSLGVDLGLSRTGIAISKGYTVRPLAVLKSRGQKLETRLLEIAEEEEVDEFIIGLPRSSDGKETIQSNKVRSVAGRLAVQAAERGWRVYVLDEHGTSSEASDRMIVMGLGKSERQNKSDAYAAVILLERYFSTQGRGTEIILPKSLDLQEKIKNGATLDPDFLPGNLEEYNTF